MAQPGEAPRVLDSVDRSLLRELQADPRISIRGLARAIGMSAGAVGERLERLESRGVVRGYRVDIDPAALGIGLEVLIGIELAQHQSVLETMHTLREVPEVSQVELVTGRWDLVVRLQLRDPQHLKDILTHDVWNIQSVRHSESMIVLESLTHDGVGGLEDPDGDE
ncbi:MAG: arsR6 [Nocardioides sp.]|jgi:Lrp/AsnC family leucine-responsive transcriptional regulator|nr:arsR6 [Nocardioides sp.]